METSSTPTGYNSAPWAVQNHNEIIADDGHETLIAEVFDEHDQWRANARLIAAAPELLQYCQMLLEDCEQMAVDPEVGREWDWSLTERNLRAIIAKAS